MTLSALGREAGFGAVDAGIVGLVLDEVMRSRPASGVR